MKINKIVIGLLMFVMFLCVSIINIKPTYAASDDDIISKEYTYVLAQEKIYYSIKDVSPLTQIIIDELSFKYRVRILDDPITLNEVTYNAGSIAFELTGFNCSLDVFYLANSTLIEENLLYSWGLGDLDTQILVETEPIIYTHLIYDNVMSGNVDLNTINLRDYVPECYINLYGISQYNDLNGLTRYGIGVYCAFDLWAYNIHQQIRLRNDTNYRLSDSRFLNTTYIQQPIRINNDITFKDINFVYIDKLIKNVTIRDYLIANPGRADLSDVDFSDWITNAVGGFMNFEVVPGLSLSNILLFIISIGLVFLFLRFFAGG